MAQQEYYSPTIPAEAPTKHPGRVYGVISIICAVISTLFFPIILGPTGIILGVISLKKGEKTLGLAAIILSAVCMVIGFILGFWATTISQSAAGATGFLLSL